MERIIINTKRDGYSIEQVKRTMTVGELLDLLDLLDGVGEDTPIYLSFDSGYTYGRITAGRITIEEIEEEEDE